MTYPCATPGCRFHVEFNGAHCSACMARVEPDDTPYVKPKRRGRWGDTDPLPCYPSLSFAADGHEHGNLRGTRRLT